ncbi:4-(cytidine 5'-diphospho)-2-C-methyl-D-erythritol kinase [Parablastomonas sp. CN1-191]|uniref:4-(cytidine 5'-diphospho)-2-C-methyl-D-erythritol kinase n=1 Tax=Parablastomonas sp. CN1-191 TaxID=3400908 RepID=UPI003BF91870
MRETAYAKLNLALHVRARRDDGYHKLETLFAFVEAGDTLVATRAPADRVTLSGAFADAIGDPFGNLVARALNALPRSEGIAVALDKALPVAAGLGGGSADAGAVFRLVEAMHGLPTDWRTRAAKLGADVPACVLSEACIGRGTGTELEPVTNDLAGTPVLLVNPRVAMPTAEVFAGWDGEDRGGLVKGSMRAMTQWGRNDLQPVAVALRPEIGTVLDALETTDPWAARMSGSGATCFALYDSEEAMRAASAQIADSFPAWWRLETRLR